MIQISVLDLRNGVAGTRIFGQTAVVQVDLTSLCIDNYVLQNRAEPSSRRVNVRLSFGAQANDLCVAPTFHIEDAIIAPAVLVVSNQGSLGIS
jgi:hypothetical protein